MAKIETDLPDIHGQNVERTSELINDGENGDSKFIEEIELPDLVEEIIENLDINGDKNFTYHQNFPSATWEIIHNLNKKPSVTITDSADTVVEGQIIINDGVKVLVTFNAPFTGIAILN